MPSGWILILTTAWAWQQERIQLLSRVFRTGDWAVVTCEDCVRCETLQKNRNNFHIPKELLSECEELDEEREKMEMNSKYGICFKGIWVIFFFFSAVLSDSWLLQQAAARLCPHSAILGAILGCHGAVPAVLGGDQTAAEPLASGKHFPRKFKKHLECLCLLKSDI